MNERAKSKVRKKATAEKEMRLALAVERMRRIRLEASRASACAKSTTQENLVLQEGVWWLLNTQKGMESVRGTSTEHL